jgi:hypothetical protein
LKDRAMPEANPRIPYRLESDAPSLPPFNGRRVVVNICVNVEHWPFDQPMPRAVLPGPHGAKVIPDVPNFTWVEYGLRVGMARIIELTKALGVKASNLSNADICTHYPRLAEAMLAEGWEFVGHGLFQRGLATIEDDAAHVAQALATMRAFSGQKVRAWMGAGMSEKADTPELLRRNGIEYLQDWLVDDVPVWMKTADGPLLSVPYTVELNDVPVYMLANQASEALPDRIRATMAFYARGGFARTRIMTIALHPHIIGVAHRMEPFWRVMEELAKHPQVTFATSSEIGDWFTALHPAP